MRQESNIVLLRIGARCFNFCISNLSTIDPMYEYSLQWFTRLFGIGIDESPDAVEIEARVEKSDRSLPTLLHV